MERPYYTGRSAAHWTLSIHDRAQGWLTSPFHYRFREVLAHAGSRYHCATPIYCLMPDHLHVLLWGFGEDADLYLAIKFLKKHTAPMLRPARYQKQAYDHVLGEDELERGAFEAICYYIAENPVRAKIVPNARDYKFSGSVIPGYPDLSVHEGEDWELFWKIVHGLTAAATKPPSQPPP
jgi:REP element-mobilizing transposase RayT